MAPWNAGRPVRVPLARGQGRRVVAATSAPHARAKATLLRELGADDVVVGYDQPWEPVEVVIDGTGGPVQARAHDALLPFGRLVVFNAVGGMLDTNELRVRDYAVVGFAMAQVARHRPEDFRRRAQQLWREHRSGRLRCHVTAYPLSETAAAHELLLRRESVGKTVLRINP